MKSSEHIKTKSKKQKQSIVENVIAQDSSREEPVIKPFNDYQMRVINQLYKKGAKSKKKRKTKQEVT